MPLGTFCHLLSAATAARSSLTPTLNFHHDPPANGPLTTFMSPISYPQMAPSSHNVDGIVIVVRSDGLAPPPPSDHTRPDIKLSSIANWLSLMGSLAIMLHVPQVIEHVPTQRKRMLIIFFTALSNFGFAFANIVTDLTSATTYLPCSVSAWSYVFFQLLTCTLVIVSTFRLCGIFLFERRRSIPSKYIIFCPLLSFVLATIPAIARQYGFNDCGHYCWFTLVPSQPDCQERSIWAWLCFYGWMIFFLAILFGSTLFVIVRIAVSVIHARSNLKQVVHESFEPVSSPVPSSPPENPMSAFERVKSFSGRFHTRTASIFSGGDRRQRRSIASLQERGHDTSVNNVPFSAREQGVDMRQLVSPSGTHPKKNNAFQGPDAHTLRDEGVLVVPPHVEGTSSHGNSNPNSGTEDMSSRAFDPSGHGSLLHLQDRPFLVAILRQALYPISISVSGCIQIIVDLTILDRADMTETLDYAATAATSIQGFLFFLVFMFDSSVVQTRRDWRKYWIWKYYIEFYYSLGMPHEGREFQDRFMQKCQQMLTRDGSNKKEAQIDLLTRPPPYSWSLQYDYLAMPSEFQTAYPLTIVTIPPTDIAQQQQSPPPQQKQQRSRSADNTTPDRKWSRSPRRPGGSKDQLPDKFYGYGHFGRSASHTADYTPPTSDPSSNSIISPFHGPAPEDRRCHPMSNCSTPDPTANPATQHVAFSPRVQVSEASGSSEDGEQQAHPSGGTNDNLTPSLTISNLQSGSMSVNGPIILSTSPLHTHAERYDSLTVPDRHRNRRRDRRQHRHPTDDDLSDSSSTDSDLDFDPYNSTSPDRRSRSSATSTTDGSSRRQRRRVPLVAPQPGDVLSFPRLSKVATIGGSTIGPPSIRRYRTSTNTATTTTTRPSKSSSAGRVTFLSGTDRSESMRPSLRDRMKFSIWNHHRSRSSSMEHERYQRQFRFPRLAYLMHMVVRLLYIPKGVRLPPIPNPFNKKFPSRSNSVAERERELDQETVLTAIEVMDAPHGRAQHRADPQKAGLEVQRMEESEDRVPAGAALGASAGTAAGDDVEDEGIDLSRLHSENAGEPNAVVPPLGGKLLATP